MASEEVEAAMSRWLTIAVALLSGAACAACASGRTQTMPPRHLSATEHDQEARRHERAARDQERVARASGRGESASGGAAPYGCYDQQLPDPDLGGERVPVLRPCWTSETRQTGDRERDADEHRREAARHRKMAASLLRAERDACAGLGRDEISHSPFFHREDIARVDPVRSGGRVVGARVVFRRVRGLDSSWMRKAIDCHRARAAALGYPPREMTYCPLMAAPTEVAVDVRADQIAVTITARRDEDAAAVLGRAQALLDK